MKLTLKHISRRQILTYTALSGLVGAMTATCLPVSASAQSIMPQGAHFRSVSVDTQPLADKGLSNYAVRVAKAAQPIVESVFADRLSAGKSENLRFVLRIDSIELSSQIGSGGLGLLQSSAQDWITGAGEVVDAHGKVLEVKPIQASLPPIGDGVTNILEIENLRTQRLITSLAEWVKKEV